MSGSGKAESIKDEDTQIGVSVQENFADPKNIQSRISHSFRNYIWVFILIAAALLVVIALITLLSGATKIQIEQIQSKLKQLQERQEQLNSQLLQIRAQKKQIPREQPKPSKKYLERIPHPRETPIGPPEEYDYEKKLDQMFKRYNDTDCEYIRDGDLSDGGYVYCANHAKKAVALLNFGVQGRDLFGCDFSTRFNVSNYQYDCTVDPPAICDTNNNRNTFSLTCLSDRNGARTKQLKYVIDDLNLTNKHIFIKINIEGSEFEAFEALPAQYLEFIDQIVMEVHVGGHNPHFYWQNIDIMSKVMKQFVNVNYHMNNWGCHADSIKDSHFYPAEVYEVTLVNKRLIKIKNDTRTYEDHPINRPNNPLAPQCQIQK